METKTRLIGTAAASLLVFFSACSSGETAEDSTESAPPTPTMSSSEEASPQDEPLISNEASPPAEPEEINLDPEELIQESPVALPEETASVTELKNILVQLNAANEYSKIGLMRTQNKQVREYAAISIEDIEENKKTIETQIVELGFDPNLSNEDTTQDNSYENIISLMDSSDDEFDSTFVAVVSEQEKQIRDSLEKILGETASAEEQDQLNDLIPALIEETTKNINELSAIAESL